MSDDANTERYILDENTGRMIRLDPEDRVDVVIAIASMLYLLALLAFFFWQLFDVWIGQYSLLRWIGYTQPRVDDPIFRLVAYALIGGGLGGVVNGIRSALFWHGEMRAFGRRYVWKYLTLPWLGVTLALFVFALVRSGMGVIGGEVFPSATSTTPQSLSTLIIGILSGYGAREVFIWLDAQVKRLFKVEAAEAGESLVPEVVGLTREEAEQMLTAASLRVGAVTDEPIEDEAQVGKVVRQAPEPQKTVVSGTPVDLTLGARSEGQTG